MGLGFLLEYGLKGGWELSIRISTYIKYCTIRARWDVTGFPGPVLSHPPINVPTCADGIKMIQLPLLRGTKNGKPWLIALSYRKIFFFLVFFL